jgi:sec-independent protein translocase protein TatC
MSTKVSESDFSDDLFAHTRMSFWDHIEELRTHMWRAIVGFLVVMVVCLPLGVYAVDFIKAPVVRALEHFYNERVKADILALKKGEAEMAELNQPTPFEILTFYRPQLEALLKGRPTEEINGWPRPSTADELKIAKEKSEAAGESPPNAIVFQEPDLVKMHVRIESPVAWNAPQVAVNRRFIRRTELATFSVLEPFMVWLKVSAYLGVLVGSPWIFYQLWSFVAAGLYPSEKRYVYRFLPLSIGLFVAGAAVCQFLVIPLALRYLLSWNETLGLEPDLRLSEWLHFAILFPLVFGVSFETPLVMLVLYKIGIVEIDTYVKHWRIALFALAIIAWILLPTGDPLSFMAMVIPLWCLYLFGIFLCKMSPRPVFEDEDGESDGGALVGV